jgi:alkanesulfonate monooxygenase SsuD/methylene tetrahydromethanopterin reductase-like flavin-dependent oxidoreductase (luciferase family)
VPRRGEPLRKLGFLTIGRFSEDNPAAGHEETLQMIELAEELGFDTVWVRQRHFQFGISSPIAVLAAAAQRTNRIELGTAVIPLGWENPLRLAEDLATVDVLSGGRLNPGVSVNEPLLYEHFRENLYPVSHTTEDFTKTRVLRLVENLRGAAVSDFAGTVGIETFSQRVQPYSPGLADRLWYGGNLESAKWAGQHGLNYLTSNVVTSEGTNSRDFAAIQGEHIDAFRAHHVRPETARVSQGLVVIPTDSATREQVRKYTEYAAARYERTTTPQGPRGVLFSPDYVGPSDELAEQLYQHAGFQRTEEVALALPFTFDHADYLQIVNDIATKLGPALGWTPKI